MSLRVAALAVLAVLAEREKERSLPSPHAIETISHYLAASWHWTDRFDIGAPLSKRGQEYSIEKQII